MKKIKYVFLLLAIIAAIYGSYISSHKTAPTIQEVIAKSTYLNSQLDKFKAQSRDACSKTSSDKNLLDAIDTFNKSPNGERGTPDICTRGNDTYLVFAAYRDPSFEVALWKDGKINFFKSSGGDVAGFGSQGKSEFLTDVLNGTTLLEQSAGDPPGFYWSYDQLDPKTLMVTQIENCKLTLGFIHHPQKLITTESKLDCEKEYKP